MKPFAAVHLFCISPAVMVLSALLLSIVSFNLMVNPQDAQYNAVCEHWVFAALRVCMDPADRAGKCIGLLLGVAALCVGDYALVNNYTIPHGDVKSAILRDTVDMMYTLYRGLPIVFAVAMIILSVMRLAAYRWAFMEEMAANPTTWCALGAGFSVFISALYRTTDAPSARTRLRWLGELVDML